MKSLLSEFEKPAFEQYNWNGDAPLLLTCDHASNCIPVALGNLGLDPEDVYSHIGWDIGALDVSKALSEHLGAPLVATKYSRLVIDCNRPPFGIGSIPSSIHGIDIPGNSNLTEADLECRVRELFLPYHSAVEALLQTHLKDKRQMTLLAIHSYTPILGGLVRPWPIGITFESSSRFSDLLIKSLQKGPLGPIGINEPYPITPEGDYGIYVHGKGKGIDAVLMEIRQDLLENPQEKHLVITLLKDILGTFVAQVRA